jgi:hypothetical protein
VLACAATTWAAKTGDDASPLLIKPVNRDGDAFDLVERSKDVGVAVLFIAPKYIGDDAGATMVAVVDKAFKLLHEKQPEVGETMAIVLVGDDATLAAFDLKQFCDKVKITAPVAGLDPKDEHLAKWELPEDLKAEFVTTEKGKVDKVIDNPDELSKYLDAALAALK